jgi:hypothetical protein
MDPVTATIIAALVGGAAAAAKDVASAAIKDAYAGLKRLISERYQKAVPFVEAVEVDPSSKPEQEVLAKQLDQQGANADADLKNLAGQLLAAIEHLREEPQAIALFDFDQLRAARNFELQNIQSIGTVLRAKDATFEGDFKAEGLRQTSPRGDMEKN